MKKGLFLLLLSLSIILLGTVGIITHFVVKESGLIGGKFEPTLSLKPFTLKEALILDIEVDMDTSTKPIESEKLTTVEEQVSEIRGLPLLKPIKFVESTEDVLRYQLLKELSEDSSAEDLVADEKILEALGLIEKDQNLGDMLTRVYTEQIAGTYDSETKVITVMKGKSSGELLDEVTTSHEITHALQDQNFDLEKAPLENEDYNGDNLVAVESLIEGDATYAMYMYADKYIDKTKLAEEVRKNPDSSSKELDNAPMYLRECMLFPYEQGLEFAKDLVSRKGEAAVDAAMKDPPMSSEQIMHPEKYIDKRDNPKVVTTPDLTPVLGKKWKVINSDCVGELDVNLWFKQYTGLLTSKSVSSGWGGNKIEYYEGPDEEYVLVNAFTWDTRKDAEEFFEGYKELLDGRFGGNLKKQNDKSDMYIYEADGELFLCAISGSNTLCLQSRDGKLLDKVLKEFPEYKTGD